MEKKKHLIFDFDETLATLKIDWKDWHSGMAKIIKKFDDTFIYSKYNVNWAILLSYVQKWGGKFRDEIVAFDNQYEKEHYQGYKVNKNLVDYIRSNYNQKNYLITNNTQNTVLPILRELKIIDRFEKIITLDDVFYPKPHNEGVLTIIDKNTPLSDYVVIGDSENDEKIAKSVGVDFIKIVFKV